MTAAYDRRQIAFQRRYTQLRKQIEVQIIESIEDAATLCDVAEEVCDPSIKRRTKRLRDLIAEWKEYSNSRK